MRPTKNYGIRSTIGQSARGARMFVHKVPGGLTMLATVHVIVD